MALARAAAAAALLAVALALDEDAPYLAACANGGVVFDPRGSSSYTNCAACLGGLAACPQGCCFEQQSQDHFLLCDVALCCHRVFFAGGAVQVVEVPEESVDGGGGGTCGAVRSSSACGDRCGVLLAADGSALDCPFGLQNVPRDRAAGFPGKARCATEAERDAVLESGVSVGAVVGGVVGAGAVLFVVLVAACCGLVYVKKKKKAKKEAGLDGKLRDAERGDRLPEFVPETDYVIKDGEDDLSAPEHDYAPGPGPLSPPEADAPPQPPKLAGNAAFLDATTAPAADYPVGLGSSVSELPVSADRSSVYDTNSSGAPSAALHTSSSADAPGAPYPAMYAHGGAAALQASTSPPPPVNYASAMYSTGSSGVDRYAEAPLQSSGSSGAAAVSVAYPSMYASVGNVSDAGADAEPRGGPETDATPPPLVSSGESPALYDSVVVPVSTEFDDAAPDAPSDAPAGQEAPPPGEDAPAAGVSRPPSVAYPAMYAVKDDEDGIGAPRPDVAVPAPGADAPSPVVETSSAEAQQSIYGSVARNDSK